MTRTTGITVCVVTGDDRRTTRQFLARLARALGPHDNVLLTGPDRTPPTDAASWRVPTRGGELRRVDGGTPPGTRAVVIFVDDRVEAIASWIDILCEAFEDAEVGAASPRTNVADGDELLIGVPYRPDEHGVKNVLMRDLAATARGQLTDATMLAGPCLAVRRESLTLLGGLDAVTGQGFDPASLAAAISATGRRLLVVEGCYLHHPGGDSRRPDPREFGRPLVTACLIVRDEQENLPRCLASMAGFADEIVVYDTGSVDGTIQLAQEAGATVVRGHWDDDFGRARNDALESCRGQWILWLDADEALVCGDPASSRAALASVPSDIESFVLFIDNLVGNEAGSTFTHPATRLFRRAHGHWQGHLHEQIHARAGRRVLAGRLYDAARIAHRGYLQSQITGKAKGERNLRSAFSDLVGDSGLPWSTRLLSLGRSYALAGKTEAGVDLARAVLRISADPSELRLARRTIIDGLLGLGRIDEIPEEIDALRSSTSNQALADIYEGHLLLAREQYEQAVAVFDRVHRNIDDDGFEYTPAAVAGPKAEALAQLERFDEAVDTLLASIRETGGLGAHLGRLIEHLEILGRDLGEIHDALGRDRIEAFVPQLLQLQPPVADRTLEAWFLRDPSSRFVLAAAAQVAKRLDIPRRLVWSARLRAAGFTSACPLVAAGADDTLPPQDRVLAAAVGVAMFTDHRARQVFGAAAISAPAALRDELATGVAAIAPELEGVFLSLLGTAVDEGRGITPAERVHRVLVIDRQPSRLRTAAIAISLARSGHSVTVLQPNPVDSSVQFLGPRGVTVLGWHSDGTETTSWQRTCEAALAVETAKAPFDVALITEGAYALVPALRRLLPLGRVVVDLDVPSSAPPGLEGVDLFLSAGPLACSSAPVAVVGPFAPDLFPCRQPVPLSARSGVCIVGDLRFVSSPTIENLTTCVAPLLRELSGSGSIVLCGDDPSGSLFKALPEAVSVGAVADPSPWIASARVTIVTHSQGAEHWLAAAAQYGTPALVVPDDPARAGDLVAAAGALSTDDALWAQFVPAAPPPADLPVDLLEQLAPTAAGRPSNRGTREHVGLDKRPEVRIVGGVYGLESLAQMNRELAVHLSSNASSCHVTVATPEKGPFSADSLAALRDIEVLGSHPPHLADLEIRHQWPPDFTPRPEGRVVCWQPWEFGGFPAEWVAPLRDVVDELWVPTTWVRQCAVRSGVPEDQVHVVPYGVDVERFRPEGRNYPLRSRKGTKLLFVGGLIERKGVDALLETYLSTFSSSDDVCLVVKPFGTETVYRGSSLEREFRLAAESGGPEIEMVDGDLGYDEMADLYRSCDALVHPYRGEGFGMPIAEAMASRLPVIVPAGGACLDFCDESSAWLVSAREVPISSVQWTTCAAGSWWLEPSRRELAGAMRAVLDDQHGARQKGVEGRRRITSQFTWEHVAQKAQARIDALVWNPAHRSSLADARGSR